MPVGLIVEDEQHLGSALQTALVGTHPELTWKLARTEDDALEVLRGGGVVFALVDLMLYGTEASRLIEVLVEHPEVVVVITSGVAPAAAGALAAEVGFHWLGKPFRIGDLEPYLQGRFPRRPMGTFAMQSAARIAHRVSAMADRWSGPIATLTEGVVTYANPRMARLLGGSPGDLQGREFADLFVGESVEAARQTPRASWERVLETRCAGGRVAAMRWTGVCQGTPEHVVVTVADVEARRG